CFVAASSITIERRCQRMPVARSAQRSILRSYGRSARDSRRVRARGIVARAPLLISADSGTEGGKMRSESRNAKALRPSVLASAISTLLVSTGSAYAQQDEGVEEVVVTGSRIVRRDFSANSPIMT